MGNVRFCEHLAHAILHIANRALEMETPCALQFFNIAFVLSRSKQTVRTTVLRDDLD